jgi:arylsulfatase A-like enzyme/thioredoxin-like negative regulator of GroEL
LTPHRQAGSVGRVRRAAVLLCFVASVPGLACGRQARLDSVLLVSIDTLRCDHVSCYGPSPVQTPHLDALAQRGARIVRAWTPVPLTTPAHASILSGLYPPAHGVRNNARFRLPEEVTTLPELLKASGAQTAAFVASFTTSRLFGLAQGFDLFDDDMGNDPTGGRRSQRPGNEVVDRAAAWLADHAASPFFVWVHLYDPHAPYEPPPEYRRAFPRDPYSGEVAFADAQLGRLLEALDRSGAGPRTVVVAVADHGEGLGTHGEDHHGILLYEEALHVPFVVAAPGRITPGTQISVLASLVDVAPTVLGLLGRAAPRDWQGRDLRAAATPGRRLYAETFYAHEEFGWSALYALREDDLKYVAGPGPELFDLGADPQERANLAESRAGVASRMAEALRVEAGGIARAERLAQAAGLGTGLDPDAVERLESLGYVAGGSSGAAAGGPLAGVEGRDPRSAMADYDRFRHAQDLMRDGRHTEAAELLSALAAADPANPQVLLRLAQSLDRGGRPAEAEAQLRRLIQRRGSFYLGYGYLSDLLEKRGRWDEARQVWLELERAQPGYVGIAVRLAQIDLAAGQPEAAASRLEAHLRSHEEESEAWAQLGRARARLGRSAAALDAFERALALHPTERSAAEGAVAVLIGTGRRADAQGLLRKLLARAPDDPLLLRLKREVGS